jgi:hypothetical protein
MSKRLGQITFCVPRDGDDPVNNAYDDKGRIFARTILTPPANLDGRCREDGIAALWLMVTASPV